MTAVVANSPVEGIIQWISVRCLLQAHSCRSILWRFGVQSEIEKRITILGRLRLKILANFWETRNVV
jgi:hypothetical protein